MSGQDEVMFGFLAENTSDVICRAGLDMILQYASPSAHHLLGWLPAEMIGQSFNAFVSAEDATAFAAALPAPHAPALERTPVTIRMEKKDGAFQSIEIRRRLLLDSVTGTPMEYILLMRDARRVDLAQDAPSPDAFAQHIPGLSTHQEFLQDLEREWSRAQREGSSLSLLRLDFNGFRQLHFLDGHRAGDECLAKAAAAIRMVIRLTDYAAHYLAEDISLLLPSADPQNAIKVATKVRSALNALRSPRSIEGKAWAAVSIGIATATAKSGASQRMPELLLLAAEHALHLAQQQEEESLRHIAAYSAHNADWKKSMPGAPPMVA